VTGREAAGRSAIVTVTVLGTTNVTALGLGLVLATVTVNVKVTASVIALVLATVTALVDEQDVRVR